MAHDMRKLLDVANRHDLTLMANQVNQNLATQSGLVKPTEPVPVEDLVLNLEDEDPFNGNVNNRNVAKRISRQGGRTFFNHPITNHTGDPNKAAEDVAKSLAINPDKVDLDEDDVKTEIPPMAPTPGSPAAKQAEAVAKAAKAASGGAPAATPKSLEPPTWKPNAS